MNKPDDVLTRARAALSKCKIRDVRRLTLLHDSGRLVVRGRVSSYYHKQLAQELIRCEVGDADLANETHVEH